MKTVDTKVLAIHREDFSDVFTLSNPNKCRISKIHPTVSVLARQLAYPRNVSEVEWQELQYFSGPASRTQLLELWASQLASASLPSREAKP